MNNTVYILVMHVFTLLIISSIYIVLPNYYSVYPYSPNALIVYDK